MSEAIDLIVSGWEAAGTVWTEEVSGQVSGAVESDPTIVFDPVKPTKMPVGGPSKIPELKCIREVRRMIYEGFSSFEVARFIQVDRCEYLEATLESLAVMIRRYIARLEDKGDPLIRNRARVSRTGAYMRSVEDLELMALINGMLAAQSERVLGICDNERKHGNYGRLANDAMRTMAELLKIKSEIETDRRTATMSSTIRQSDGTTYQQVLEVKKMYQQQGDVAARFLGNDDTRRKLLTIFDRINNGNNPELLRIVEKNKEIVSKAQADELERSRDDRAAAIFDPDVIDVSPGGLDEG